MTPLDYALAYLRAGISVIPIRRDGSKAPAVPAWKDFIQRRADEAMARLWWGVANPPGLATIGGKVSRGLEVIDFDVEAGRIFPLWQIEVAEQAPGLLERLAVIQTPRLPSGYHVGLRCLEVAIPGNAKLASLSKVEQRAEREQARAENRKPEFTLIETRGEGGYVVTCGSPPECHTTGRTWEHQSGPQLWDLLPVTAGEREVLWTLARYFDRTERPSGHGPHAGDPAELLPGTAFDRDGPDWAEILGPAGWILADTRGEERRWRRPDKDRGWSATTGRCKGKDGSDLLRVFSSNAPPFELDQAYGKFRAHTLLNHAGDLSAAASELARRGFGSPRKGKHRENGRAGGEEQNGRHAPPPSPLPDDGEPLTIQASEIPPKKVQWLWPWRIPLGKLTTFAGIGGLGKTFVLLYMAARVSCGASWPDGSPCMDGEVLFISGEDDPDDTLVPRLIELGADLRRVRFLRSRVADRFTLADLPTLERAAKECKGPLRLIVIDPPTAYLAGVNDNKNSELRALLTPLKTWAQEWMVALVFNTHINKTTAKVEALARVMGSVAWVNAVRAAHLFARDNEDPDKVLFVPMKYNLSKRVPGLLYRIEPVGDCARIEWLGEVDTTADNAINQVSKPRKVVASEWLIERFREKLEWSSADLFAEAKAHNISRSAVFEAKETLKLPKARKVASLNGDSTWVWWVPADWPPLIPTGSTPTTTDTVEPVEPVEPQHVTGQGVPNWFATGSEDEPIQLPW